MSWDATAEDAEDIIAHLIKEKYIEVMLRYVTGDGDVDITTADYAHSVREYLLGIGMAEADVDALTEKLVRPQA